MICINHEELKTVYPPLTQAVFLGVAAASRALGVEDAVTPHAEVVLFKLVFGAFDLATAAALWFLATRKLRLQATVLYLLCPAVIVQTWESAHSEAAAVFLCVLAAALLVRRRDGWAGVALGLAAAFKVTPLALLVPALLGGRASPARFLAGFAPAFLIPYVPYLVTGGSFGSLFQSGSAWTGGSLIFTLLARLTTPDLARWLALALFAGGALWIAGSVRGRDRTAEAFTWTFTLLVLCLPVVHAWYWLTPLALGLAAGLWLPLIIAMAAPLVESLPLAADLAAHSPLAVRRRRRESRPRVVCPESGRHTEAMTGPSTPATGRTIAVMARPLVRGAVKTRLARALGDDGALAVYERLLGSTLDAAEQVPGAAFVLAEAPVASSVASDEEAGSTTRRPEPADPLAARSARWTRLTQRGDGLGERLAHVFADLFAAGAARRRGREQRQPGLAAGVPGAGVRGTGAQRPRPRSRGRRRVLPHRRRPADLGRRSRPAREAARDVADEQRADSSSTPCVPRTRQACMSRSFLYGSTSTSRPTSACWTGSRAGRRCAASRSAGFERSIFTSPTAAHAPAGTATTARTRPTTS